jgi:hypothetical protein
MAGGAALFPFEELALLPFDDAVVLPLLLGLKTSSSSSLSSAHGTDKLKAVAFIYHPFMLVSSTSHST